MVAKNKGLVAGLALGVGAAGAAAGIGLTLPQTRAYAQPVPQQSGPSRVTPLGQPASFADIFQRVSPAVVSIVVTTKVKPSELAQMEGVPFPFNQLPQFQNRRGGRGGQATPRGRGAPDSNGNGDDGDDGANDAPEAQAAGSGFFVSADGYIVTNNHVVEDATKITVTLPDQTELEAKVVGRDEASDLAVVKVQGTNFPFVTFETQAKPRVGDWVLAVGNPLQLGGTATAGIVSSIGRDLPQQGGYPTGFLQIDAPINRGNSGGPTFDLYGRVIGVNTAIYSQSGGSIGIGFAVPADVADSIVRQLMAGKTIQRGYLGATIQNLGTDSAQALGLSGGQGASIADVVPTGPGARAGLQAGDVGLTFNGEKVLSANALTRAVGQTHAGDSFRLGILRGGRRMEITVRSGVRPSESTLNSTLNGQPNGDEDGPAGTSAPSSSRSTTLGVSVGLLTPAIRQAAGIPATVSGVVIESVRSGSDASRKGLSKGDVIVQANQQPMRTPTDLVAALAQVRKEGRAAVFLLINTKGRNVGVPIKFDDRPRGAGE